MFSLVHCGRISGAIHRPLGSYPFVFKSLVRGYSNGSEKEPPKIEKEGRGIDPQGLHGAAKESPKIEKESRKADLQDPVMAFDRIITGLYSRVATFDECIKTTEDAVEKIQTAMGEKKSVKDAVGKIRSTMEKGKKSIKDAVEKIRTVIMKEKKTTTDVVRIFAPIVMGVIVTRVSKNLINQTGGKFKRMSLSEKVRHIKNIPLPHKDIKDHNMKWLGENVLEPPAPAEF